MELLGAVKQEVTINGLQRLIVKPPFDIIQISITKVMLDNLPATLQMVLEEIQTTQLVDVDDVTLSLVQCIVPILDQGGKSNQMFFYHVACALLVYLGSKY